MGKQGRFGLRLAAWDLPLRRNDFTPAQNRVGVIVHAYGEIPPVDVLEKGERICHPKDPVQLLQAAAASPIPWLVRPPFLVPPTGLRGGIFLFINQFYAQAHTPQ